ncbi:unnamed protein product [Chondrus crispus]|uniref:Uncharacterized protein n=1 Tax=Chondrus crispus TaxID=2769 RepID=R7QKM7_CHOCR|nr:unnamed protein product [Chondrus crispus]CDF38016.1 unnamed protein product [Chondrus crispus]|eukprot:XP_005717885.1 unnamed protein product [Chondrus crispus]
MRSQKVFTLSAWPLRRFQTPSHDSGVHLYAAKRSRVSTWRLGAHLIAQEAIQFRHSSASQPRRRVRLHHALWRFRCC